MPETFFYALGSVVLISLVSLIGIITFGIKTEKLKSFLIYMLAFSAGALLGDAFFHLIPELAEEGFDAFSSSFILLGIVIFFIIEKFVHWQHCHMPITKEHKHPFAYTNLVGDALHNFLDGIIIASAYIISIPAGIATSVAVLLHEIPQEIGDFGVLIHGGFTKSKALLLNLATALFAVFGTLIAFGMTSYIGKIELFFVPIAIGGFIYIAGSDLIPELHKETKLSKSIVQLIAFILGMSIMALLLLLE